MNNLTRNMTIRLEIHTQIVVGINVLLLLLCAPRTGSPSFNQIRQSVECEISSYHDVCRRLSRT